MISLDLSRVTENSTLISALMTCCSAWMESALLDPAGGQRWVIYDEAWRLMSQPSLLRRMDAHWRLARHYGIANALIFHKLTDLENVGDTGSAMRSLANSLLANAETRIIYRPERPAGRHRKDPGLTTTERNRCLHWRRAGLVHQGTLVRGYSRLHPAELELFDTSARAWAQLPAGARGEPERRPGAPHATMSALDDGLNRRPEVRRQQFFDEDPETFGAGYLVFYPENENRSRSPSKSNTPAPTGRRALPTSWTWTAERRVPP